MGSVTFTNPASIPPEPPTQLLFAGPAPSGIVPDAPASGFSLALDAGATGAATVEAWAYVSMPLATWQARYAHATTVNVNVLLPKTSKPWLPGFTFDGSTWSINTPPGLTPPTWSLVSTSIQSTVYTQSNSCYLPVRSNGNVFTWIVLFLGSISPGGSVSIPALPADVTPVPMRAELSAIQEITPAVVVKEGLSDDVIALLQKRGSSLPFVHVGTVIPGQTEYDVAYGDPAMWMITMVPAAGSYPFTASF